MYVPLHLRLTLFYALILGLALWLFGNTVYTQAEQRAYHDLDSTLSSRAASVRLGKDIFVASISGENLSKPLVLPAVDGLGNSAIAIEVLDDNLHLIASTTGELPGGTSVSGMSTPPVPWDSTSARQSLRTPTSDDSGQTANRYSTILFNGQRVRVFTLLNRDFDSAHPHIIQTARSEVEIEQSLASLRLLLLRGGILVLLCALLGGWLLSWGVLAIVRKITRTAHMISTSRDFSQRVPSIDRFGQHEFAMLAATFNQMLASLEEAYQRQQRFVADASHELRAPITSIRCNLDLLAIASDLPAQEAQAALADARAEAERMGRLVNDLLILARIDDMQQTKSVVVDGDKHYQAPLKKIDLDSLLLDVYRQYRHVESGELEERGHTGPRLSLQHITPIQVSGDADQLKQAIVALIDNALKYTPSQGYVYLSLNLESDYALLKISDSGIGILPEDLPHIFERFYRADQARTRESGGSGLGLAIAQSIVQDHKGSIEVESVPGKGSTFTIKLPVPAS
jgi:two-component system OmpR family sensor kinase